MCDERLCGHQPTGILHKTADNHKDDSYRLPETFIDGTFAAVCYLRFAFSRVPPSGRRCRLLGRPVLLSDSTALLFQWPHEVLLHVDSRGPFKRVADIMGALQEEYREVPTWQDREEFVMHLRYTREDFAEKRRVFYGAEKKAVIDMCRKNLEAGTIVRIDSADAKNICNATLVTKKNGELRACMNVVSLNKGYKLS